jgi:hypothetical protein
MVKSSITCIAALCLESMEPSAVVICIHIPECVVAFIYSICSDQDNNCIGHCDIDEDGNECNNESFKTGLPDSREDINFDADEKA